MLNLHERLVSDMAKIDELKRLIAETLKVNVSDIDEGFSLKAGRFKTSAGSVILSNIFRKVYGQKVDCRKVNTFGELLMLAGEGQGESQAVIPVETAPAVDNNAESEIVEPENDKQHELRQGQSDARHEASNNFSEFGGSRLVCGIDIQEIDIFPDVADFWTDSFYTENFTKEEIAYCVTTASPRHSFAGRWCVKEALHKCSSKYFNVPLKDIRVTHYLQGTGASSDSGQLRRLRIEVRLNGLWKELQNLTCSLSHADNYAVGMVTGWED